MSFLRKNIGLSRVEIIEYMPGTQGLRLEQAQSKQACMLGKAEKQQSDGKRPSL
jgi:hypothetical protein